MPGDELDIIQWLSGKQKRCDRVLAGIGDDMAVLRVDSDRILLTCDMLLDGVHFDAGHHDPAAIGRKALACSLSDCAAMAVRPVAALASVALPVNFAADDVHRLLLGLQDLAEEYDVVLVGGDTTRWSKPLVIDVTVVAEPFTGIDPVMRSGAKVGDRLYVTGPLGGSLMSRHLTFTPRVREAKIIAETLGSGLHAMMDISDGLSLDLWRMTQSSGVGAELSETLLEPVIHEDARRLAEKDRRAPLDHALSDGEDFELLLAVEGRAEVGGIGLHPVGIVTPSGLTLVGSEGTAIALEPRGFVH
ncbi:MAG: thiamine-phosphate kinase [Phycisphaerae bacterium]|nr:thiamine-phosphate kinase [Phycisphaerae bacterium]